MSTAAPERRDEGSALLLVLVLLVVGTLVTLPLLSYAVTVLKSNEVLSDRNARTEAVKAGFRHAMAEPQVLYETCGTAGLNVGRPLASPGLDIATETECFLLDVAAGQQALDLPWSVATTFAGASAPSGPGVVGPAYPDSGAAVPGTWWPDASPEPHFEQLWVPNLPVHALNLRSPLGYQMPPGYSLNGYSTCTVYFPGTYRQPVVVDSATYFTSGVYYFEDELRFAGGADAVGGSGKDVGCVDDQYAAFYATNAPSTHNISGLGVTFVMGDEGRLVIDDSAGDVSLRINQRYVSPEDVGGAPAQRVSLMTVNGDLDEAMVATDFKNSGLDLLIPNQLEVPLSFVGSATPRDAPEDQYRPSTLTPEPRPPKRPTNVTGTPFNGAVTVSWNAPTSDGGSPITSYKATSSPGGFECTTAGQTSCAILGLSNLVNYRFTVVATNDLGTSPPSAESDPIHPQSYLASLAAPGTPTGLDIELDPVLPVPAESRYRNTFVVSWDPPPSNGGAPITQYLVEVRHGTATWTCSTTGASTCAVTGLPSPGPVSPPYRISVKARNAIGDSGETTLLNQAIPIPPLGVVYVPPVVPAAVPYSPDPVLDISTTGAHDVTVSIAGYVAVPQGVVRIAAADPDRASVRLQGGVLTAWTEIIDPRPSDFTFGLMNPTTQRVIRIVTRTTDGSNVVSDAVVQINENEGWAVNSWEVQPG